jgi:phosphoribosylformylglycinamidine synthase subunit PurS
MGTVIVDVMPKPEILDPQGQAVAGALARMGLGQFGQVRQGKRFELTVEGEVTDAVIAAAREAAATLLSNPVIEDVASVREAGA